MEAASTFCIELAKETSPVSDANGRWRDMKASFEQPTVEEVSRLSFGKSLDIRIHAQELRNEFARLLNRGSSLE